MSYTAETDTDSCIFIAAQALFQQETPFSPQAVCPVLASSPDMAHMGMWKSAWIKSEDYVSKFCMYGANLCSPAKQTHWITL